MRRIIAVLMLAVALVACGGSDDPERVKTSKAGDRFEVVTVDGVKCIVYHDVWGYAGGGGISCDWTGRGGS